MAGTAHTAVPAAEALSPLLGWGDADLVYVTYGKIWFPLFLAFTLCAFVIYQRRRPGRWETWVWRVALTGYVLACAGVFVDYGDSGKRVRLLVPFEPYTLGCPEGAQGVIAHPQTCPGLSRTTAAV
jgi:hypothetical protein